MSKFKDGAGRWLTTGLFAETAAGTKEFICMTLAQCRKDFIECGDMLGVVFADKHLGGYQHWKAIQASPKLAPYIAEWQEELEARIRSDELFRIKNMAESGQFQASKFLLDRGWDKRIAGRPSKDEVEREVRVAAKVDKGYKDDILRIKR